MFDKLEGKQNGLAINNSPLPNHTSHTMAPSSSTNHHSRHEEGPSWTSAGSSTEERYQKDEYHDFASEPQVESSALIAKEKNGSESNFPVKLHYMLSDMEADGLDHIVSWQAHGRSFTVNKPKEFVEKILPL